MAVASACRAHRPRRPPRALSGDARRDIDAAHVAAGHPFQSANLVRDCGPVVRGFAAANHLFCRTYHQLTVVNPNPLPATGPAILVCNHISGLDPLLLQSTCRRVVIWMMAKEFYELRAVNWALRRIDAIPVARSGRDSAGVRAALRALDAGRVLGLFPEGGIEPAGSNKLKPFQTGVAQMAIRTGAAVYPAFMDGTNRGRDVGLAIALGNEVRIRFGPAVEFDRSGTDRDTLQAATDAIQAAVEQLRRTDLGKKAQM